MANRLDTIVTRGGDGGETSLGDGARVSKTDPRIHLLGDIDELNSYIGVILAHEPGEAVAEVLNGVQHDLFDLGGALCFPGAPLLADKHIARLDDACAIMNEDLPPLKEFILPGGAPLIAHLHVGRTVCRRVERSATAFLTIEDSARKAVAYLNRLSDFLFVAARVETRRLGLGEVQWDKARSLSF